jgi:XcyI-like restriction endonuclease
VTSQIIKAPSASRQIAFHQVLVAARKTWLMDALSDALGRIDPNALKRQLSRYVPSDAQQILAAAGVRHEHVFPTPIILETKPTLVGYYHLLLGVSQKTFYGTGMGLSQFKSMETRGVLSDRQKEMLPTFCKAMSEGLAELVRHRREGFRDFWTIIAKKGLDLSKRGWHSAELTFPFVRLFP